MTMVREPMPSCVISALRSKCGAASPASSRRRRGCGGQRGGKGAEDLGYPLFAGQPAETAEQEQVFGEEPSAGATPGARRRRSSSPMPLAMAEAYRLDAGCPGSSSSSASAAARVCTATCAGARATRRVIGERSRAGCRTPRRPARRDPAAVRMIRGEFRAIRRALPRRSSTAARAWCRCASCRTASPGKRNR